MNLLTATFVKSWLEKFFFLRNAFGPYLHIFVFLLCVTLPVTNCPYLLAKYLPSSQCSLTPLWVRVSGGPILSHSSLLGSLGNNSPGVVVPCRVIVITWIRSNSSDWSVSRSVLWLSTLVTLLRKFWFFLIWGFIFWVIMNTDRPKIIKKHTILVIWIAKQFCFSEAVLQKLFIIVTKISKSTNFRWPKL